MALLRNRAQGMPGSSLESRLVSVGWASIADGRVERMIPLNRDKFVRINDVSAEAWARQHEITPYTGPCARCGAEVTTSIPFTSGEFRGLMAPPCACGHTHTPFCIVRDAAYGDLLDLQAKK